MYINIKCYYDVRKYNPFVSNINNIFFFFAEWPETNKKMSIFIKLKM